MSHLFTTFVLFQLFKDHSKSIQHWLVLKREIKMWGFHSWKNQDEAAAQQVLKQTSVSLLQPETIASCAIILKAALQRAAGSWMLKASKAGWDTCTASLPQEPLELFLRFFSPGSVLYPPHLQPGRTSSNLAALLWEFRVIFDPTNTAWAILTHISLHFHPAPAPTLGIFCTRIS